MRWSFQQLQYELKSSVADKETTCVFCAPSFKSKQNTWSSGQRGQITRLEIVIEEGEGE